MVHGFLATVTALALFIAAVPATAAEPGEIDQTRRTLEEIRQRIKQTARSLEEKKSAELTLLEDLKSVETKMAASRRRLEEARKELAGLERKLADQETKETRLRQDLRTLETQVRRRLVVFYKSGDTGLARLLFSASSPAKAAEDYQFLKHIVRRDRELLGDYRRQLRELETVTRDLGELEEEKRLAVAAQKRERENLAQAGQLKKDLIAQVRRDQRSLDQALRQLKTRAEDLSALLKKLESAKTAEYTPRAGGFEALQGKLPWPAPGPVRIGFGQQRHPELGTLYDSQGLEIAAGGGRAVAAVADGSVIYASWFKGFGNLLVVDHGDSYYTLYAQADRLTRKVGEPVKRGDTLAFTGPSPDDGLYFEIRLHGTPLNPTAWLAPR